MRSLAGPGHRIADGEFPAQGLLYLFPVLLHRDTVIGQCVWHLIQKDLLVEHRVEFAFNDLLMGVGWSFR